MEREEREVMFARTLEQMRGLAKKQGNCVRRDQVREAFEALELEEGQLALVFDYLEKHGIGIDEPGDPDDALSDQERDVLRDYLEALEALPVCEKEDMERLTLAVMSQDPAVDGQAKQQLTEAYLKDVADIARLYAGQGVPLEDLIGEGNVALAAGIDMLGSLESPDQAPGMLMKRVMDAMEEQIRENADSEKIDSKVAEKVNGIADRAKALAEELCRKVTPGELSRETGLSLKSIEEAMRMSGYRIEDIVYAQDSV